MPPHSAPEIRPEHPAVVATLQDPAVPHTRRTRLANLFPGGQFLRYLLVGAFNTLFGYASYAVILTLLSNVVPQRYLSLTAVAASILSTPLNITVAYLGYKFFVFKTHGNFLREWLKCFAVYGVGMIPGLVALGVLTRLLQTLLHRHAAVLRPWLYGLESHLSGHPLLLVQHLAHGHTLAGYIAGAIVIGVSTIYSFVGHKKITFKPASA